MNREPLRIDELRTMVGKPVWIPEIESYAIVKVDKVGRWANKVFVRGVLYSCEGMTFDIGVDFEYDVERRKLYCYSIDQRAV